MKNHDFLEFPKPSHYLRKPIFSRPGTSENYWTFANSVLILLVERQAWRVIPLQGQVAGRADAWRWVLGANRIVFQYPTGRVASQYKSVSFQ